MKKLTLILMVTYSLMLFSEFNLNAQVDQTFWFVVPETTRAHNKAPGILRITAFDKDAVVTISQPANSVNFQPITINVPANSQKKVEFHDYGDTREGHVPLVSGGTPVALNQMLWSIENGTLDAITKDGVVMVQNGITLNHDWHGNGITMDGNNNPVVSGSNNIPKFNKGLLIESDADISAYYEVANGQNPERFNLKGSNALGTEFLIPSQNLFKNHTPYSRSREKVDIVATEDGTDITIFYLNHHDFVGKPETGDRFTITLNRGQTISLRSINGDAGKHLGGIFIESGDNKKIAITISDDSIQEGNASHWDLVGDQLIPVSIAGTEYIAMHPSFGTGYNQTVSNRVFIWPVSEEEGKIYINGDPVKKDGIELSFKRGDFYVANITQNGIYIKSDLPVIVYQISSVRHEMGSGVLPALECTGSKQVSFARVYGDSFFLQILTKKKNIRDQAGQINFEVITQNDPNLTSEIFGSSTEPIENHWNLVSTDADIEEGEQWYSFTKLIVDEFSTNEVVTVKFKDSDYNNDFDRLFHLSVLDAHRQSMSFGYFSAYNALSVDPPGDLCIADGIELTTNATNASWYHGSDPMEPFATNTGTVTVESIGEYWVEIPGLSCGISERVYVEYAIPDFDLGADRIACPGELVELGIEALSDPAIYNWYVNGVLVPGNNTHTYSFTAPSFTATDDTTYIVLEVITTEEQECTQSDNIAITVGQNTIPDVDLIPEVICEGTTLTAEFRDGLTYQWVFDGIAISDETYITPTEEGLYTLTVSNGNSACDYVKEIDLTIHELPEVTLDPVMACIGVDGELIPNITSTATPYTLLWKVDDVDVSTSSTLTLSQPSENIVVEVTDANGCMADTSASFGWYAQTLFEQPEIIACYAGTIVERIDENNEFSNFVWTYEADPTDPASIRVALTHPHQIAVERELTIIAHNEGDVNDWAGRYHVKADDFNGCPVEGYFDLIITPPPDLELVQPHVALGDPRMCEGDTITITYTDIYDRQFTNFRWSYRANSDPIGSETVIKDGEQAWIAAFDEGQYYLYASMENGCDAAGEVPVTTANAPIFELLSDEACPETDIVLGINPGTYIDGYNDNPEPSGYEWRQAPVGMEITDQYPVIGTDDTYTLDGVESGVIRESESYRLTVFNEMGCFASEFATATSLDATPINLSDVEICDNVNYTLAIQPALAVPGSSYQWHQLTPFEMMYPLPNSPWPLGAQDADIYTYRLDYTNPNGCFSSGTMTLTVLPSPEFTLPTGSICEGETISITDEASYVSYEWNGVAGDNTYEVNSSGNVTLVVTDENGCTTTASTTLTARPLPPVTLEGARICPGETTTLLVPFDQADYNILWTSRNNTVGRNINSIQAGVGTYSVTVGYADDSRCAASAEAAITAKPVPSVDLGPDRSSMCQDDLPLIIEVTGDRDNWEEIQWLDGLYSNVPQRPGNTSPEVNFVRVRNTDGCWSNADQSIQERPETVFDVGRDVEGCEPTDGIPFEEVLDAGEFTLYEDASDGSYQVRIESHRWFEANDPSTTLGTHHTFTATASGQYLVEVFDGCWPDTATFNIDLYPNPDITRIDSTIYRQVVVFAEGGTEPYSYALNNQNPQNDRIFRNLDNGEYTIYVIDNHGCEASINFLFESNYDIKVPNFFTPNGDGFNDTWVIEGIEKLPESIIYIYDRYGKLLKKYGSNDPAWNGHYLNQPVPSDDYWYVIHLLPVDKYIKGNFTLKR